MKNEEQFEVLLRIRGADVEITGIKEYSDWQTIPQLYIANEFVGGTDILMSMHQDGSLSKLLEEKDVLVPAEGE